jgi:2-dehydro-3-deoxyphosphogluconate aldolase/(4S)-4-hydroxy-2-oxoglutarate aldolase
VVKGFDLPRPYVTSVIKIGVLMSIETSTQKIKQAGIISILRGDYTADDMLRIGEALLAGSVTAMEVTLNSPNALEALPALLDHFGERLLVGAGTVREATQARHAIEAGAQFLVSPNFDAETVAVAHSYGVLHFPGIYTATEVQTAYAAGCRMLKLFPMIDPVGPAYLRALRGPFQDVDFMPTGGISLENIADFARAGAVAVGVGAHLVSGPGQATADVTARALALRAAWDAARHA